MAEGHEQIPPEQAPAPEPVVQYGYGEDFVDINDGPKPQKQIQGQNVVQEISIPIAVFDQMVQDYIRNRREKFMAAGLVSGSVFDDDPGTIQI
jgi:hypothetical protein